MAELRCRRDERAPALAAVKVRSARAADWPVLRELWQELDGEHAALQPGFFRQPPLPRRRAELTARLADSTQQLLVAERDGAVIGAVRLQVFETPPQGWARVRRRGYLDDLIVAAAARGAGVGQTLLQAALAACRGRGVEQVALTVWQGNAAAERIYRRLGFRPASRVLALELDAGAAG